MLSFCAHTVCVCVFCFWVGVVFLVPLFLVFLFSSYLFPQFITFSQGFRHGSGALSIVIFTMFSQCIRNVFHHIVATSFSVLFYGAFATFSHCFQRVSKMFARHSQRVHIVSIVSALFS